MNNHIPHPTGIPVSHPTGIPVSHKPVHPGGILAMEAEGRGLAVSTLAKRLGLKPSELRMLLAGKAPFTAEIAESLERELGTPAHVWLDLQRDYDTHPKHGGARPGAGRPKRLQSKQVRISAEKQKMEAIQAWLSEQDNQAQAIAEVLYQRARHH